MEHNFFSFHFCDRAARDEQVEKRIKIQPCVPERFTSGIDPGAPSWGSFFLLKTFK